MSKKYQIRSKQKGKTNKTHSIHQIHGGIVIYYVLQISTKREKKVRKCRSILNHCLKLLHDFSLTCVRFRGFLHAQSIPFYRCGSDDWMSNDLFSPFTFTWNFVSLCPKEHDTNQLFVWSADTSEKVGIKEQGSKREKRKTIKGLDIAPKTTIRPFEALVGRHWQYLGLFKGLKTEVCSFPLHFICM